MIRRTHLLHAAIIAITMLFTIGTVQAADIVRDGQPRCTIVLVEEPARASTVAADELVLHLEKITGQKPEIVKAADPEAAAREISAGGKVPILIGAAAGPGTADALATQTELDASFILAVTDRDVRLAGHGEGVIFAASELLEQLGVRWFMPGDLGTVLPEAGTLVLRNQQTIQSPSFPSRHFQGLEGKWKQRMRCGGESFPGAHGIPGISNALFKEHPEFFSLVNGTRQPRQHCISNPELIARATEAVREAFRKRPAMNVLGVGPNDGVGFCECPECHAIDGDDYDPFNNETSVTDRYIWLLNQILEGIEDEFPDKKIGFYIYHSYMRPPVRHQPHRNVAGALAPISLCRIHGPGNPLCTEKQYYAKLMKGWSEALDGDVWERGYWSNLADPGLLFIIIHRLRVQIPLAKEANLRGWRVETFNHYGTQLPSFYIAAKLMWNHEADVDALVKDFAQTFYGPAADAMESYTWLMNDTMRDADYHTGCSWSFHNIYTAEVREQGRQLLDQAAAQVPADSAYAARVQLAREAFLMMDHFVRMMNARIDLDLALAGEELKQLDAVSQTLLAYNPPMILPNLHTAYMRRFFRLPTEQGAARVTGGNRLLAACPDEWSFKIDPTAVGETLEWYNPDNTGDNWITAFTSSKSWSDQGLRYYKGMAWYRTTVEIPADALTDRTFLWCGGVDEKAKVWVNGQSVGISHGAAFYPFEMDATAAVKPGTNTIVFAVNNARLNELGTGGIKAPVILYAPQAGQDAQLENIHDLKPTFP